MTEFNKSRRCSFCGKLLECDCFYSDYGLVKLDNSGKTYVDFDACESCLKHIEDYIRTKMRFCSMSIPTPYSDIENPK